MSGTADVELFDLLLSAGIAANAAYRLDKSISYLASEVSTLRDEMKEVATKADVESLRKETKADIESLRKDIKISMGRLFWHLLLGGAALATLAVAFIDWLSRLR